MQLLQVGFQKSVGSGEGVRVAGKIPESGSFYYSDNSPDWESGDYFIEAHPDSPD